MEKEILCKKCETERKRMGSYHTQRHILSGKSFLICPHRLDQFNIESIGSKLAKLNKIREKIK